MKNRILLIVAIVLSAISLQTSKTYASNITTTIYNSNDNSMTFVEDGITFSIFKNGEFDFYINSLGNGVGASYESPGVSISYNSGYDYDPYVQYDNYGAVIQIENTPIYYDNYGRIRRAGSINIHYNSGRLNRIGGLNIYYNNYGRYSHCDGFINIYNRNYVYHPYHNWFVRPYIGFNIVRYRPYRYNYNPYRYTYYRDHRYAYKHRGNRHDIRQRKRNAYKTHSSKRRDRVHNDYRRTTSRDSKSVKRGTTRRVADRNNDVRSNRNIKDNNTVRRNQGNTQSRTRTSGNTTRRIQNDRGISTRNTERRTTAPTRQRSTQTRQSTSTRSQRPTQTRQSTRTTTQRSQRPAQTRQRQATRTTQRSTRPAQTRQRQATSSRKSPSRSSSTQRSKSSSKSRSSRGTARR